MQSLSPSVLGPAARLALTRKSDNESGERREEEEEEEEERNGEQEGMREGVELKRCCHGRKSVKTSQLEFVIDGR